MAKRVKASFLVTVTMPEGKSRDKAWVRKYIKEAVEMWSGQQDPEGPIFYFCSPYHGGKTVVRHVKD